MNNFEQEEKILRHNNTYHTIDTKKDGVRFRNSALRILNDEYLQVKDEYQEQQKSVVAEIIKISGNYIL